MKPLRPLLLLLPQLLLAPLPLCASADQAKQGIAYEQKLGNLLPKHLALQESTGRTVRLEDLLGGKPLILVPGYFRCPNLCGIVRASLLNALNTAGFRPGRDYFLAAMSIDPSETSADASAAKEKDMESHPEPGSQESWHYLTGRADTIDALCNAVGFRSSLAPKGKTFIHPTGAIFVAANGRISSYVLGAGFALEDVRRALASAASSSIAPAPSPVLLLCFDYDAATGRYTPAIMKLLRLAAALTVAAVALLILRARMAEKQA
ncbi:MAG: SCO family protein [Methylocapsa sp.]|nr:SCO family protein [Methylocapsa sp.]